MANNYSWGLYALLAVALAAPVSANTTAKFNFTGSITKTTCGYASTDVAVPLGDVNVNVFSGIGSASPWVNFSLVSTGCSNVTTVQMKFTGTAAAGNSNLFAVTGGAAGAGVDIQTYNNQQAVPNGSASINWGPRAVGATYDFKARYMQTQVAITSGTANAVATVLISYI
ncbi:MAG: fimbrial protein [Collimonas sp.]|uniref:fimbrial protein n=1 Tax=Collimonas sp. TaxID=1963772 RepID=UPI0032668A33